MIIKRIGPLSCAKITGTLYAIVGLLIGGLFSIGSLIAGAVSRDVPGGGMMAMFGIGSIIFFPLLYGAIGFVTTLVGAWLYNILAGMVGGVEMDVQMDARGM